MSEQLIRAAKARHQDSLDRATAALSNLSRAGERITFAAVARRAGVSTDFLYNTPALRSRINELRTPHAQSASNPSEANTSTNTAAIRALSSQLKEQRRRHRDEVTALQKALAVAHGDNLELRRRLAQLED